MFSRSELPIELEEAKKSFLKIHAEIKDLIYKLGYDYENIRYDQNDLEESFLVNEYRKVATMLEDVEYKLNYLSKPIIDQGYLRLNEYNRYAFPSGEYLTSGNACEILHTDSDNEQYWLFTTIEHNGSDYYATSLGKDVSLKGRMARIRR